MKKKDGKVVLGKNDTRIGNFVITKEDHHYKMQDVAGFWSLRIGRFLSGFMLIEECLKSKNLEYLESICKMFYAMTTTPPDAQMLMDMYNSYNALMDRMRAAMPQVSEEEQQEILKQEEILYNSKQTLQKVIEDGDAAYKERKHI